MTPLQRMRATIERLRFDERGTTITEFVLTLPIFIFIFVGILKIGTATSHSVVVDARAYKNMWNSAIPVQKQPVNVIHGVPALAGAMALGQLAYTHTSTPAQRVVVLAAEGAAYGAGMIPNGTMGESFYRVRPVDPIFNLLDLEGNLQSSLNNNIIGNSQYVADLMDESANFSRSGGGALSVLNAAISATGTRPAIAAGMRYGTVAGFDSDSSSWLGFNVNYSAHFTTLVAPYPMGTYTAELMTTAIARLAMESHNPYSQILGIAYSQPLNRGRLNVPDLKPVFWAPCGVSGCNAGGP